MRKYLEKLTQKQSLTKEEMLDASQLLFSDEITDCEIVAFVIALKSKGETADEIASLVSVLRQKAITINGQFDQVMDNCGTGGDGSQSFNISTASAFVLAGAGIKVAKHGNRSVSSKTGSADVLEALDVNLHLTNREIEARLEEIGIAFLFAQKVHPNISRIMKIRKELKIPTVFNFTGPLTNPIQLDSQLLGISKREMLDLFASVLDKLGRRRALIINGAGYMDEASLQGTNSMILLENGKKTHITLSPEDVGLPYYTNDMIRGGEANENADIMLRILQGEKGAYRDTVLLNAGLGIYANGKTDNIREGIAMARESIDSGQALKKLEALIHFDTNKKAGVM